MNGVKQTYDSVSSIIESGGSIFTASLYDISGGHGEILVCLIDNKGVIRSFAMSCRVFQRKIEYVFIYWLHKYINFEKFNYMKTDRNGVFQEFINEDIFINKNDSIRINNKSLTIANKKYNNLVDLSTNF
jgi:predicted enzyme involved in methoxymalonyl-ACP biosynthesis